jgi:phosphoadenosine phosphosulfate reductase
MADILTTAQSLVEQTVRDFKGRYCYTCSFQVEDMVLLHLIRQADPGVPVLFLDTGYHFPETTAYRDQVTADWKLNLVNITPPAEAPVELYKTDPAGCCNWRKVKGLMANLDLYDAWITGLRREQSPTRANLQFEEKHKLPSGKTIDKISPLAEWTWKDVNAYATINELPRLSLYDEGYTSIGCAPCTLKPVDPNNLRSGRWAGSGKLECGLHTATEK